MSDQLTAELCLTHRSPTYAIRVLDGRVLHVRREADIRGRDGSIDRKIALAYAGDVTWVAECDGRESRAPNLAYVLWHAMGPGNDVLTLFGAMAALVEAAVPNEPPIRLEDS